MRGYLCGALAGPVPIPEADWLARDPRREAGLETEVGAKPPPPLRVLADELRIELADEDPLILYLYPEHDADDAPATTSRGASPICTPSIPRLKTGSTA